MKIFKNKEVKTPLISTTTSVGIDFYVPNKSEEFINHFNKLNYSSSAFYNGSVITVNPHCKVSIPSGLHIRISEDLALILHDKSSIAINSELTKIAGVIDSDYKDEMIFCLINYSNIPQTIKLNEKIIQGILIKKVQTEILEETNLNEMYANLDSNRDGGFGSTGNQ